MEGPETAATLKNSTCLHAWPMQSSIEHLHMLQTFGSSRGIFRRTCTSTHIVTTMPFADRGSMVRLLVDSHLPKVGS